jgi:hypothetical protein
MSDDKTPTKTTPAATPTTPASSVEQQVAEFARLAKELGSPQAALHAMKQPRGRLIFAMDATQSREPTWEMARNLQADMFRAASGLQVQLVYYRGWDECGHSKWESEPGALELLMGRIACQGGYTQIRKILEHARNEMAIKPVNAVVFVGDAMEEKIDVLCGRAAEVGVPVFVFQEGDDPAVEKAFKQIAQASGGAHFRFDAGAADQLRDLLAAVAVYATQGTAGLETQAQVSAPARLLLTQLKK